MVSLGRYASRRVPRPRFPLARYVAWLLALSPIALGCGQDPAPTFGAVSLDIGPFGALMVSSEGQILLPIVSRDEQGVVSGLPDGVLWMDSQGGSAVVWVDPQTGLPTRSVVGGVVFAFANWDPVGRTVDVATIYAPTEAIEIRRGVPVPVWPDAATPEARESTLVMALTCLPNCPTELQTLSEELKVGGMLLSAGVCLTTSVVTWGAMLLPCGGAILSLASLAMPDDPRMENLEQTGRLLALSDAWQCSRGGVVDCVSFFNTVATETLDLARDALADSAHQVERAESLLADPSAPAGLVNGDPPPCDGTLECRPGAYLPCLSGGTRRCSEACTWGGCTPADDPHPGEPDVQEPDTVGGAHPYDGTWEISMNMGSCGPPGDLTGSTTISLSQGAFHGAAVITYQPMGGGGDQVLTFTDVTVEENGSIDGYFTLTGCCCGSGDPENFYGWMDTATRASGHASSYWGSVLFARQ